VLLDTASTTAMMFFILIGALLFSNFVNLAGLPGDLSGFINALDVAPIAVLLAILGIYLLLGMALESLSMVLLTVPIFYPIVASLGFDLIWFGIIVVVVTEISLITPPIGLNVFVLNTVLKDVPDRHDLPGGDAVHRGRHHPPLDPGGAAGPRPCPAAQHAVRRLPTIEVLRPPLLPERWPCRRPGAYRDQA
jgi:hypothetical protein